MHPRTPLLTFCLAMSVSGCSCQWQASTQKTWSTSGGNQVVVVQDPEADARERDARMRREREWERQREFERGQHPRTGGQGGRISTGTSTGPHGSPIGSASHSPTPIQAGSSGSAGSGGIGASTSTPTTIQAGSSGANGSGGFGAPTNNPAPIQPGSSATSGSGGLGAPSAPAPVVTPAPAPAPAPAPDTYVPPRNVDKPAGGPPGAGTAGPVVNQKNQKKAPAAAPRGRMQRAQ